MLRLITFGSFYLLAISANAQGSYAQQGSSQQRLSTIATAEDVLSSLKQAEQVAPVALKPMLTGSAELGFLYKTGNSNSGDFKSGLDLNFEHGQWRSLLNVDLLIKKSDVQDSTGKSHFKTTDQKWGFSSQTNYSLASGEKNYIYGNIWFEESEFNSFINQSSISSGWGRHWYKTNQASLWADIGPGYKRDILKATTTSPLKTEDSWIIQLQALYVRKLGSHVEFKQILTAKHAVRARDNSIYKAETTVTTKLISTLQLKFTFTIDYNTEVEENRENLDTQTAATLVYSF
ncbi:MAG: DUF481 domain-containing protein [Litorilituus sp.]|jgi:putative salt-induced outer membrane protein YdiY|nr:DUF481 domain-containing protein [Litorilituus sp.]